MQSVSVIILAKDEERNIAACIQSAQGLGEVVVIDTGSVDRTAAIARQHGARVINEQWLGFAEQRQRSLSQATHDWVLFLDADERLSPELLAQLVALEPGAGAEGYWLRRRNYFLQKPMRNYRWANDWQLRLFRRDKAVIPPVAVHEGVTVPGRTARITQGAIDHDTVPSLGRHIAKLNRYTTLEARQKYQGGQRYSLAKMIFSPAVEFWKLYLVLGCWRDGLRGLAIAALSALYKLALQGKLLELGRG
jgi:glycosyltransferase involved in cell wall biosynthesis